MIKQVFKTMVAFLAVATMAIGPVRGQNAMAVWPLTAYGDLQTGDTVVILDKTSAKALPSSASSTTPSTVLVTLNSAKDTLISPAANLLWVVTKNGNTYQFNQPGSSNYLYFIDYSNGVRVGNNSDNQFTFQNGGAYNVPFLKHNATSSYLGLNDAGEWRCAGSISNTSTIKNTVISFYKKTVIIIPTYTVRMAAGTEDAEHWSLASGNASVPGTQVLENVMSGSQVTATYSGTQKVKSVKAVKYVPPAATVTTAPTATAGIIEAGSTTALVNAGTASGGTMMYAVTTTNAQPTSTADFSATRPTAEGRSAGTYYVWFYVKADADHSDSEIADPVSVTLAVATPALSLTSPSVGQVIGSDGKNYAAASVPSGVTKVAMIAYVSGSNGLAIALADEGSLNWETAKSTCEAKTPAFTGGTWKLPTQAEWNQMFSANGGDEESYTGLNTAINTAGGTALLGGKGYWSSTPDGSKAYYVWLQDGDTDWRSLNVNITRQVRACLAF